ncbi:CGNR zinc finger domain-containing protein [Actinomadura sp. NPDC048955]|uniref:CGNR zinc finger domain-containing protein n=1 Tax=Actinomadura sp. NPDC048955 TaxID=3158228 RepID=UPI003402F350
MAKSRYRLDNDVLSFRFTATRIDRSDRPRELLEQPGDLHEWFALHGLQVEAVGNDDLQEARALREAIHRVGTALAGGGQPALSDVAVINAAATAGRARRQLGSDGERQWVPEDGFTAGDALGVLAEDAIEKFSAHRDRIKACGNPACRGLFLDSSRARNRRWCSMNFCGNRNKKLNFRHGHALVASDSTGHADRATEG